MPIHYGNSLPERDMTPPDGPQSGLCKVCGHVEEVIDDVCYRCAQGQEFDVLDDESDEEDLWL